jgi:hypothetical protein
METQCRSSFTAPRRQQRRRRRRRRWRQQQQHLYRPTRPRGGRWRCQTCVLVSTAPGAPPVVHRRTGANRGIKQTCVRLLAVFDCVCEFLHQVYFVTVFKARVLGCRQDSSFCLPFLSEQFQFRSFPPCVLPPRKSYKPSNACLLICFRYRSRCFFF